MSVTKKYVKSKKAYKVTFSLPKPTTGADIRVLGEFNNWSWDVAQSMKKSKDGYKVDLLLDPGKKYEFRYCIDRDTWMNDDRADSYKHISSFGIENCVVDLLNIAEEVPAKKSQSKKTDLTAIEGVGPKIASLLADAGYATHEAVAMAKPAALKQVLLAGGKRYTMHDPTSWPKQAQLLATGDMDRLKKLQDVLKGGRKVK